MGDLDLLAYYNFFNESKTPSFVINEKACIVGINTNAKEIFCKDNYNNISIREIAVILNNNIFCNKLINTFNNNQNIFEFEIQQPDKKIIPYEVYTKKIIFDNKAYVICNAHTIINKKEVENIILSAVIETEEKERSRFAKDLHDGLGPLLSTIKLYVHELNSDDNTKKEKEEYINYIIELLDEAVTNTREISNNLTPQIISTYGLVKSIESFKNKINATNKLDVSFTHKNIPDNIERSIRLTLFRIITELINNSIKHAMANSISLELFAENGILYLIYKDDGIGFNLEEALKKGSSGIGLTNIINRIKSMSGDFTFNDKANKGIDMRFTIKIITENE